MKNLLLVGTSFNLVASGCMSNLFQVISEWPVTKPIKLQVTGEITFRLLFFVCFLIAREKKREIEFCVAGSERVKCCVLRADIICLSSLTRHTHN